MSAPCFRVIHAITALAVVAAVTACNNDVNSPRLSASDSLIESAFGSAPVGFNELSSSYAGDGITNFAAEHGRRGPGRDGFGDGIGGGFMGGGLGGAFFGGIGVGRGHERGNFASGTDSSCSYSSSSGDVTCGPTTRNGITITRVLTFKTASGASQSSPDSTTDSERSRITVGGTFTSTRRDSITSTVQHSSDRTVTGLAAGSTSKTVNGVSSGTENTSGVNREGVRFTSVRVSGDTVAGLVIPKSTSIAASYPTMGTVRREMKVTMTLDGGTPTVSTRREVITYDGSATATVVITRDGTSKTCTLPLPRGRMVCPE